MKVWNSCRAAMLQGAEPVTTAYKLPFGAVAFAVVIIVVWGRMVNVTQESLIARIEELGLIVSSRFIIH